MRGKRIANGTRAWQEHGCARAHSPVVTCRGAHIDKRPEPCHRYITCVVQSGRMQAHLKQRDMTPPALARICGTAVRVPILRSPYALLHYQRTPAEAGGLVRHLRLGVYQGRLWGPMPQGRVSGGISGNHAKAPAAPHSVVGHRVEPQFQGMAGKVVGGCQKTRPSTSSAGTR